MENCLKRNHSNYAHVADNILALGAPAFNQALIKALSLASEGFQLNCSGIQRKDKLV